MLVVARWWRGGRWAREEAVACGEAEAVRCHDEGRGLEGRRPMLAAVAFVLAGASAVEDDSTRAQPRGLLLCFGQRDHRAAHRPTNADDREHIPGFFGSLTTSIEELKALPCRKEHQLMVKETLLDYAII